MCAAHVSMQVVCACSCPCAGSLTIPRSVPATNTHSRPAKWICFPGKLLEESCCAHKPHSKPSDFAVYMESAHAALACWAFRRSGQQSCGHGGLQGGGPEGGHVAVHAFGTMLAQECLKWFEARHQACPWLLQYVHYAALVAVFQHVEEPVDLCVILQGCLPTPASLRSVHKGIVRMPHN